MFIENFLTFCAARLTQRYLSFKKYSRSSPPGPVKGASYLLYIHIPFCEELCPYCAFARIRFEASLADYYFDALEKEIKFYRDLGYSFDSIYIGGGTPTIVPDRLVRVIEFVKNAWPIRQVSIETNPNHLTDKILRMLKDVGVNRLSVGVQSFDNKILQSIHRLEKYGSGEEIREKLLSVSGMFDTLNIDMIFNMPNQTSKILTQDIEIIKKIRADQVTYYPLMVSKSRKKLLSESCGRINHRREKQFYRLIVNGLADTYNQQSVWCFSRKKGVIDEYIIDHDEYVGVGLGSWGCIKGSMYSNTFSIHHYINALNQNKHPIVAYRSFSKREQMHYNLLLKLLDGNLNLSYVKERFGNHFWAGLWPELLFLLAAGAVTFRDSSILLTPKGRYYYLIIMRTLFSIVGDYRDMRASLDAEKLMVNARRNFENDSNDFKA
ncbi:MAG: coproporphyrinogen III oxidase family protein [Planctomycetota bacterium]|jgi:coproporphyrinogen III oxidase-like Fe-S oxidoreductase